MRPKNLQATNPKKLISQFKVPHCRQIEGFGPLLASLMIEHNVGVTPFKTYVLKKLDADYFDE